MTWRNLIRSANCIGKTALVGPFTLEANPQFPMELISEWLLSSTKRFWTVNILGTMTLCISSKLIKKFCLNGFSRWLESGAEFSCLRCESKGIPCSTRPAADVIAEQDPMDTTNRFSYFFTIDHQLWSDAKMERIRKSRYDDGGELLGQNEMILVAHNRKK